MFYILNLFGGKFPEARRGYLEYVKKGVSLGLRPDLTGGGLVRSAGGWSALRTMRKGESRMKGNERILGQEDFVESVLKQRRAVKARSVLCYSGTRELGMSAVEISKKLNIASSTASESVTRGRQIVQDQKLKLLGEESE